MNRERSLAGRSIACLAVALASAAGCAREGLDVPEASVRSAADAHAEAAADARTDDPRDLGPRVDGCTPVPEACNGLDDDCDGQVDEGVEILRCPNGGESICISGSYSTCPRRCEVCVPGSERVCFVSFCKVWGRQVCQADGYDWGGCSERDPPSACAGDGPFGPPDEPSTGDCCLSLGLCCVDRWDSDRDGDTHEAFGACDATLCE